MSRILYKHLDIEGAKCMIGNSNLQFTNATQLNDPFDCHPKLFDYSSAIDSISFYVISFISLFSDFTHKHRKALRTRTYSLRQGYSRAEKTENAVYPPSKIGGNSLLFNLL